MAGQRLVIQICMEHRGGYAKCVAHNVVALFLEDMSGQLEVVIVRLC